MRYCILWEWPTAGHRFVPWTKISFVFNMLNLNKVCFNFCLMRNDSMRLRVSVHQSAPGSRLAAAHITKFTFKYKCITEQYQRSPWLISVWVVRKIVYTLIGALILLSLYVELVSYSAGRKFTSWHVRGCFHRKVMKPVNDNVFSSKPSKCRCFLHTFGVVFLVFYSL